MYDAEHFSKVVQNAIHVRSLIQFHMDTEWQLPYKIDEISVLWKFKGTLEAFTEWCVAQQVEHFNAKVLDRCYRNEIGLRSTWFDVQFEFLRLPTHPWRIEAMAVLKGRAPLHEAQLRERGEGCVMHASFKVPDEEALKEAYQNLAKTGFVNIAEYRNSYGLFSYWQGAGFTWIKPRVNLRDQAQQTTLAEEPGAS